MYEPPPPALGPARARLIAKVLIGCTVAMTTVGPGAPENPIKIVGLDKGGETVTIRNVSGVAVDLNGWWICLETGNQLHAVLRIPLTTG